MDSVDRQFPGAGLDIPAEEEWERADALVGEPIPRSHNRPVAWAANRSNNRAFLRSRVRRALYRQFNERCDAQEPR